MSHGGKRVMLGGVDFFPDNLLSVLVKLPGYGLTWCSSTGSLELYAVPIGGGGLAIIKCQRVEYVVAAMIAGELGLKGEGDKPTHWFKSNPSLTLYHDGSPDADRLSAVIAESGIPHRVTESEALGVQFEQGGIHQGSGWPVEKLIEMVRETAARRAGDLATKP